MSIVHVHFIAVISIGVLIGDYHSDPGHSAGDFPHFKHGK